jgi:hypothetical protein
VGVDGNVDIGGLLTTGQAGANFAGKVSMGGHLEITGQLRIPGPVRPEPAAQFGSHVGVDGNLDVAGDIHLVNADCAEDFDVAADCEELVVPGSGRVDGQGRLQGGRGLRGRRRWRPAHHLGHPRPRHEGQ